MAHVYLIALFFSCILWLKYGIELQDLTTMIVNFVGLLLSIYALLLYYHGCERPKIFERDAIFLLSLIYGYLFALKLHWISINTLGPICCILSFTMLLSPLFVYLLERKFGKMKRSHDFKTHKSVQSFQLTEINDTNLGSTHRTNHTESTDCYLDGYHHKDELMSALKENDKISLYIYASAFVSSSSWVFYGIYLQDKFIAYPNIVSSLISGCQVAFCFFSSTPP